MGNHPMNGATHYEWAAGALKYGKPLYGNSQKGDDDQWEDCRNGNEL